MIAKFVCFKRYKNNVDSKCLYIPWTDYVAMAHADSFDLAVEDPMYLQYVNVKFDGADIGRVFQDSSSAIPIEIISQEF